MKHVLFRGIDVVSATSDEIVARILEANATQRPLVISFVNPHSFNLLDGAAGRGMRSDLDRMDIVLADGIGVVWAIRLLLHDCATRLSTHCPYRVNNPPAAIRERFQLNASGMMPRQSTHPGQIV